MDPWALVSVVSHTVYRAENPMSRAPTTCFGIIFYIKNTYFCFFYCPLTKTEIPKLASTPKLPGIGAPVLLTIHSQCQIKETDLVLVGGVKL